MNTVHFFKPGTRLPFCGQRGGLWAPCLGTDDKDKFARIRSKTASGGDRVCGRCCRAASKELK